MKLRISQVVAALLASGTLSLASAQIAAPPANQPEAKLPQPPAGLVAEPVASASRTEGPGTEITNPIVQDLVADASLRNSKITVQPDGEVVLLTGVTQTRAQMKRAVEIATAKAGEGKVVNAITTEEFVVVQQPEVQPPVATLAVAG